MAAESLAPAAVGGNAALFCPAVTTILGSSPEVGKLLLEFHAILRNDDDEAKPFQGETEFWHLCELKFYLRFVIDLQVHICSMFLL